MSDKDTVEITSLEKDDRAFDVIKIFFRVLQNESSFKGLNDAKKEALQNLFEKILSMKFDTLQNFKGVADTLIRSESEELIDYIDIALKKSQEQLPKENKGVLVIYTGGTIGSAPKDANDPDSPEVVKSWKDLKGAVPKLDRIGFPVDAISFVQALDSCNVGPDHWRTMAEIIERYYHDYEGFVILHGTDTMVYTASALSFMIEGLGKPVVITGSQISGITNLRNDADQNFITSLYLANPEAANIPVLNDVCICFGGKIIRGCRSKKVDASGFVGFDSPNCSLLGTSGDNIDIDKSMLKTKDETDEIEVLKNLETNVLTIDVFPGIQKSEVVQKLLSDDNLKGVVLRSYGTGNIPTDKEFLAPFKEFCNRGGVVVNVSQCSAGSVEMGLYETSQLLLDIGILGGFDITPEAALTKLMVLLGEQGDDIQAVKKLMQQSLAGEQEMSVLTSSYDEAGTLNDDQKQFDFKPTPIESVPDDEDILRAILRFKGVELKPAEGRERLSVKLFIDLKGGTPDDTSENFAGVYAKAEIPTPIDDPLFQHDDIDHSLAFDVTVKKDLLVSRETTGKIRKTGHKLGFTVLLDGSGGSFSWKSMDLDLFTAG